MSIAFTSVIVLLIGVLMGLILLYTAILGIDLGDRLELILTFTMVACFAFFGAFIFGVVWRIQEAMEHILG